MNQYLIEFEHDSKYLGQNGFGMLLITAETFEKACDKIVHYSIRKCNPHHKPEPYYWDEYFRNPRNFIDLTIE
jgi:hypothetical protein